jgi:hypothetical protein
MYQLYGYMARRGGPAAYAPVLVGAFSGRTPGIPPPHSGSPQPPPLASQQPANMAVRGGVAPALSWVGKRERDHSQQCERVPNRKASASSEWNVVDPNPGALKWWPAERSESARTLEPKARQPGYPTFN